MIRTRVLGAAALAATAPAEADRPLTEDETVGLLRPEIAPQDTHEDFIAPLSTRDLIAQANDSVYGLAAGVWTRDFPRAWRVAAALQVPQARRIVPKAARIDAAASAAFADELASR